MARRFVSNRRLGGRSRESVTITGFDELYRQLEVNLPKATQRGVLQRSGKEAMEPMLDRAIALAPERTGATKRSIRIIVKFLRATGRYGSAVLVQIGAGDRDTFWPKFLERGTVKMRPHAFMRPAFDSEVAAVIVRLKAALAAQIRKAVERRATRLAKRG